MATLSEVCSFSRGDPQRRPQRPRSKITESWRLKITFLERKSWRRKRRIKRRTKVSSQRDLGNRIPSSDQDNFNVFTNCSVL